MRDGLDITHPARFMRDPCGPDPRHNWPHPVKQTPHAHHPHLRAPYAILDAWRHGRLSLVVSPEIMEEYRRVINGLAIRRLRCGGRFHVFARLLKTHSLRLVVVLFQAPLSVPRIRTDVLSHVRIEFADSRRRNSSYCRSSRNFRWMSFAQSAFIATGSCRTFLPGVTGS
jgi:hypothetical protein